MKGNLSESLTLFRMEEQVEGYRKRYRKQMDLLEQSPLARLRPGGITQHDFIALGKQLEAFEVMNKVVHEDQGNVNLLGKLPDVAFDVITVTYGASIIPLVASVQPIEEERGTVYFRRVRAATTKGSQTSGDVLSDPRTPPVYPNGFASAFIGTETGVASTTSAQVTYSFTLAAAPIKAQSLTVTLSGGAGITGMDIGAQAATPGIGQIWGNGISGTVNYSTGVVSVTLAADPGNGKSITVGYQQNYELATDIPQIDSFYDNKPILARVYALKGTSGMFQTYAMQRRFGKTQDEELAKDLVQQTNSEIGSDLIKLLNSSAPNAGAPVVFSRTPPNTVSYFEHKQTYKDFLAQAERVLVDQSGRGQISLMIVGKTHAQVISTLPGFVKMYDGALQGIHVFGTLDGTPVIRVTDTNVLGTEQGLMVYKGLSPFEAAAVYSPFMPLTLTDILPQAPNPLNTMRAAAVWAGVDSLVPQFVVRFDTSA